VTLAQRYSE